MGSDHIKTANIFNEAKTKLLQHKEIELSSLGPIRDYKGIYTTQNPFIKRMGIAKDDFKQFSEYLDQFFKLKLETHNETKENTTSIAANSLVEYIENNFTRTGNLAKLRLLEYLSSLNFRRKVVGTDGANLPNPQSIQDQNGYHWDISSFKALGEDNVEAISSFEIIKGLDPHLGIIERKKPENMEEEERSLIHAIKQTFQESFDPRALSKKLKLEIDTSKFDHKEEQKIFFFMVKGLQSIITSILKPNENNQAFLDYINKHGNFDKIAKGHQNLINAYLHKYNAKLVRSKIVALNDKVTIAKDSFINKYIGADGIITKKYELCELALQYFKTLASENPEQFFAEILIPNYEIRLAADQAQTEFISKLKELITKNPKLINKSSQFNLCMMIDTGPQIIIVSFGDPLILEVPTQGKALTEEDIKALKESRTRPATNQYLEFINYHRGKPRVHEPQNLNYRVVDKANTQAIIIASSDLIGREAHEYRSLQSVALEKYSSNTAKDNRDQQLIANLLKISNIKHEQALVVLSKHKQKDKAKNEVPYSDRPNSRDPKPAPSLSF